jgi:hypothetical protein
VLKTGTYSDVSAIAGSTQDTALSFAAVESAADTTASLGGEANLASPRAELELNRLKPKSFANFAPSHLLHPRTRCHPRGGAGRGGPYEILQSSTMVHFLLALQPRGSGRVPSKIPTA